MTDEEHKAWREEMASTYEDGEPICFLDPYELDEAIVGVTSVTADTSDVRLVYSHDKLIEAYKKLFRVQFPEETDEDIHNMAVDQVSNDTPYAIQSLAGVFKNYPLIMDEPCVWR